MGNKLVTERGYHLTTEPEKLQLNVAKLSQFTNQPQETCWVSEHCLYFWHPIVCQKLTPTFHYLRYQLRSLTVVCVCMWDDSLAFIPGNWWFIQSSPDHINVLNMHIKEAKIEFLNFFMLKRLFFFSLREIEAIKHGRGTRTGYVSAQRQGLGNTPNPRVKRAAVFQRRTARGGELPSPPGRSGPGLVPLLRYLERARRSGPVRSPLRHTESLCLSFSGDILHNKPS